MKRILIVLSFLLIFSCDHTCQDPPPVSVEINSEEEDRGITSFIKRWSDSVVSIRIKHRHPSPLVNRWIDGGGTAFFITEKLLVTCHHVMKGGKDPHAMIGGKRYDVITVINDEDHDISIIEIIGYRGEPLKIADEMPEKYGKIKTFGYPLFLGPKFSEYFSEGYYMGDTMEWNAPASNEKYSGHIIKLEVAGGNSGSPVWNEDGEVVGMVQAKGAADLSLMVEFRRIKDLIERHKSIKETLEGFFHEGFGLQRMR